MKESKPHPKIETYSHFKKFYESLVGGVFDIENNKHFELYSIVCSIIELREECPNELLKIGLWDESLFSDFGEMRIETPFGAYIIQDNSFLKINRWKKPYSWCDPNGGWSEGGSIMDCKNAVRGDYEKRSKNYITS